MDQPTTDFEAHRAHLRSVAYRMLGSLSEADDAVQDAWLRFSRAEPTVDNLRGWLTTVVARVCLNVLRTRRSRREQSLDVLLPEPIVRREDGGDPQDELLLADSVGLALLIVLETLTPPERVAFVLHDVFAVPFEDIAPIVGRTALAARQLASRGRRRVHGRTTLPDTDITHRRAVVDAFRAATRDGDFDALLAVLDPDVVVRSDAGPLARNAPREVRGAAAVAKRAASFGPLAGSARPAMVNGDPGLIVVREGRAFAVLAFSVAGGRIVEIDIYSDPSRLGQLDPAMLEDR